MEVLFHLVFVMIKVAILSCLYGLLFLIMMRLIKKRRTLRSTKTWMILSASSFVLLFVFMNTYWGDHGLGDSARIPVGYGEDISQINGVTTFIEPQNYDYGILEVETFAQIDNIICGKTLISPVGSPAPYFVWNLSDNKVRFFKSKKAYHDYAQTRSYPIEDEFKSFHNHYNAFWGGWRFWLLA